MVGKEFMEMAILYLDSVFSFVEEEEGRKKSEGGRTRRAIRLLPFF
jgi:hypothetical protein